ncbi:hypothetical protein HAX54_020314, partial [Datura stramonium]|nr:hypothetical protein [Datura stramonium]
DDDSWYESLGVMTSRDVTGPEEVQNQLNFYPEPMIQGECVFGFWFDDLEAVEYWGNYQGCLKACVDSNLESDTDEGEDFEMGETTYTPPDDEE